MKRRKRRGGRVPGVPVPSTEKSRAASRVAGWKTGKFAKVVSAEEVYQQRLAQIESGLLGTDSERDEVRQLQRALEDCDRDFLYLERAKAKLESNLRDRVLATTKVARSKE